MIDIAQHILFIVHYLLSKKKMNIKLGPEQFGKQIDKVQK